MRPQAPARLDLRAWLALALLCVLGLALAGQSLGDEGAVSLDGDMARYVMNGVLLRDFLVDLPLTAPLEWAQRYYAKYPALSLGHHPVVPAMAEAAFYLVFGISIFSAQLSTLCALALTIAFWFRLILETYDLRTAVFATLLLVSIPGLLPLFQIALSEPYALCLITMSLYYMHRYCTTERRRDAIAFGISVVLSIYAKQLAAFLFPVYAFQFVNRFGLRALFQRSTVIAAVLIGACMVPIVPLTLTYSPFNVMLVSEFSQPGGRVSGHRLWLFVSRLWSGQLHVSLPLLALSVVSMVFIVLRMDRRSLWLLWWIAVVYVQQVLLGIANERFMLYWLPAFCALGAAAPLATPARWRPAWAVLLTAAIGYQFLSETWSTRRAGFRPLGATGYEDAARYVTGQPLGDTILYSAAIDTGYFVFFVRKHDPNRERIVLRADKVLTTSRMRYLDVGRRIASREEILPIMKRYGVGYVVIEDRPYPDGPLRWLQEIVQTPEFERRRRFAIESDDRRMKGATLSVYEYRGRTPAETDASLAIDMPVVAKSIEVRLADLKGSAAR
jgi:4-amino-4-deoxy-L-arabinose transferase-like glycosyltransferase